MYNQFGTDSEDYPMLHKEPLHQRLLRAAIAIDMLRRKKDSMLKAVSEIVNELRETAKGIADNGVYYAPNITAAYSSVLKDHLEHKISTWEELVEALEKEADTLSELGVGADEDSIARAIGFCLELSKQLQHRESYRRSLVA